MFNSFSCHKIYDVSDIPFTASDYSKFKFGDGLIAREFGTDLANQFIEANRELLLNTEEIVVLPSPYNSIPTASYWMGVRFIELVNLFLAKNHRQSLLHSKIHRYKTYSEDYGNMDYDQRLKLITTDTYHIDSEFLKDRTCLFIDDIKITGSHEHVLRNLVTGCNIEGQFIFIYFAELMNSQISPTFENVLNYSYVKSIEQVSELMNEEHFVYNTRVIKYVMKIAPAELEQLTKSITAERLKEMVKLAISNNYHLMPEYESNLNYLIKFSNYGD